MKRVGLDDFNDGAKVVSDIIAPHDQEQYSEIKRETSIAFDRREKPVYRNPAVVKIYNNGVYVCSSYDGDGPQHLFLKGNPEYVDEDLDFKD